MSTNMLNADILSKMFLAGARNLEAKKEWINELNVFPVPDGDTGTNMTLTIMSAANEVAGLKSPKMEDLAKAIASGSLRGARGNSGVILSQLLRGFTKGITEHESLDAIAISLAMEKAVETAYKAVMKPKEGTILTVAKAAAYKALELAKTADDLGPFFREIVDHAKEVLAKTPEMLPVLKEAGVVDSGGQGLVEVLQGALDAFEGKEVDYSAFVPAAGKTRQIKSDVKAEADIKFGYCTEFIINLEKDFSQEEENRFKDYLLSIGDSLVCVAYDDIVKVHVHTNDPGLAISKALTYGSLSRMKIDNMREEHEERLIKESEKKAAEEKEAQRKKEPAKDIGFIAVSVGEGIGKLFRELGADYLIEGGQTMNPSTEDMLKAIENVNAKTIFILPNNKNIILAANQAQSLVTDKEIFVIPTKTVPQGISVLINYVPEKTALQNEKVFLEELNRVKTGQVTYAVRDTRIDDKEIRQGDIMGIGDQGILSVGQDVLAVSKKMIQAMVDEDSELISIYYGEDMKQEEAEKLAEQVEELYPDCDVEVNYGGQPIYYCIVSVE